MLELPLRILEAAGSAPRSHIRWFAPNAMERPEPVLLQCSALFVDTAYRPPATENGEVCFIDRAGADSWLEPECHWLLRAARPRSAPRSGEWSLLNIRKPHITSFCGLGID